VLRETLQALEMPTCSPYLGWPEPPAPAGAAEPLHPESLKGNESSVTRPCWLQLAAGGGKPVRLDERKDARKKLEKLKINFANWKGGGKGRACSQTCSSVSSHIIVLTAH